MMKRLLLVALVICPLARTIAVSANDAWLAAGGGFENPLSQVSHAESWTPPMPDESSLEYVQPARFCWFAGADYRLIRTHFSEALAFATLTASVGPQGPDVRVAATELDFEYESSFAVFFGYHLNDQADLRFSYWTLDTSTGASGAANVGQVIVDPFGNLAPPGTVIDTLASVQLNVFDIEYVRNGCNSCTHTSWSYSVGLRFADVTQFYESAISAGPALVSDGVFNVDFSGMGPCASFTGHAWANPWLSGFAKVGGALLVGQYDISTDVAITGQFTGGQSAERIRTVPILESELGVAWAPSNRFRLSTGWLVQAWMNIGVSGGTFDGENLPLVGFPAVDTVFGGADDSDIMSFDGFFVRGEFNY